MILASALAVRGAGQVDPLLGNAKLYDGAFDYDIGQGLSFDSSQPRSYLFSFYKGAWTGGNFEYSFQLLDSPASNYVLFENNAGIQGRIRFQIASNSTQSSNRIIAGATTTLLQEFQKYVLIITYDGSSTFAGINIYVNGLQQSTVRISSAASITPFTINNANFGIGANAQAGDKLSGAIKQLEQINRVATAQEIADASAGGSFTSAGIARDSGEYVIAVDFDKTNGNPPVTFANTPPYTITSFGGAEYVDYQSL